MVTSQPTVTRMLVSRDSATAGVLTFTHPNDYVQRRRFVVDTRERPVRT
jgi:hypothetical protein